MDPSQRDHGCERESCGLRKEGGCIYVGQGRCRRPCVHRSPSYLVLMLKQQDICLVVVVMTTFQDNANKTADTWLICQTVVSSFWSWLLSMTIQRNLTLLLMLILPYLVLLLVAACWWIYKEIYQHWYWCSNSLVLLLSRGHFRWLYKKSVDTCVDVEAAKQLPRWLYIEDCLYLC